MSVLVNKNTKLIWKINNYTKAEIKTGPLLSFAKFLASYWSATNLQREERSVSRFLYIVTVAEGK